MICKHCREKDVLPGVCDVCNSHCCDLCGIDEDVYMVCGDVDCLAAVEAAPELFIVSGDDFD